MCTFRRSKIWLAIALATTLIVPTSALAQTPARDLGAEIAAHPRFGALSASLGAQLTGALGAAAALSSDERRALIATLERCRRSREAQRRCIDALERLAVSLETSEQAAGEARRIAADVGLSGADRATVDASFRHAQQLVDGTGESSGLAAAAVESAGIDCSGTCRERAGNVLGNAKGDALAKMAQGDGGGDGGDGGADGAVTVGTVIAIGTLIVEGIKWLEDSIWDSDEEDKACESDSDCPSGDYCHKVGENDCRPKLAQGKLCSRGGNCKSNCCKPHISTGFLPSCRPADKC